MRRFFIDEIYPKDSLCIIPEKEAKHMVKVLRMKRGDRFILMGGKGDRFEAVIEEIKHHEVCARIVRELPVPSPSPVSINICQALIRPRMMDYLVEKTSELGVAGIIPFYSERTVIKVDESKASNKAEHWKKIACSASKQSGRPVPADIFAPMTFDNLIETLKEKQGVKVVLWESENRTDLKEFLRSEKPAGNFTGIIGPEGGFAEKEINQLRDAGIIPVSLGPRILRAETAAMALTTIIQYEWGDLGI